MILALFFVCSGIAILVVEIAARKLNVSPKITRRLVHLGTMLIVIPAPLFVSRGEIITVSAVLALVLVIARRRGWFSSIHTVERTTLGDLFLPAGVGLSALLFLPGHVQAFQYGMCIMGLSDVFAGFVGEWWGRHRVRFFGNTKSLEGSLTFFFSSVLITFIFLPVIGYQLLLIPLILTVAEFCFIFGIDNILLPILGALLLGYFL